MVLAYSVKAGFNRMLVQPESGCKLIITAFKETFMTLRSLKTLFSCVCNLTWILGLIYTAAGSWRNISRRLTSIAVSWHLHCAASMGDAFRLTQSYSFRGSGLMAWTREHFQDRLSTSLLSTQSIPLHWSLQAWQCRHTLNWQLNQS